jgi:hypothetical protein
MRGLRKGEHTDPEPHGRVSSTNRCTSIVYQKGRLIMSTSRGADIPSTRLRSILLLPIYKLDLRYEKGD